jgi:hypothetical protein
MIAYFDNYLIDTSSRMILGGGSYPGVVPSGDVVVIRQADVSPVNSLNGLDIPKWNGTGELI